MSLVLTFCFRMKTVFHSLPLEKIQGSQVGCAILWEHCVPTCVLQHGQKDLAPVSCPTRGSQLGWQLLPSPRAFSPILDTWRMVCSHLLKWSKDCTGKKRRETLQGWAQERMRVCASTPGHVITILVEVRSAHQGGPV